MNRKISLLGLLFITILTISCNLKPESSVFDFGHVENNKYLNSFFGLEIDIPNNWDIKSKEETEFIAKMGKEMYTGDNKDLKETLDAVDIEDANLLTVYMYKADTVVSFNPNFILVADNLKNYPDIKNGSDYLSFSRKLLEQSESPYDYMDEKFTKVKINDTDFYYMNLSKSIYENEIKQVYYATVINGFCVAATISYLDNDQKGKLEKMINSMIFKK